MGFTLDASRVVCVAVQLRAGFAVDLSRDASSFNCALFLTLILARSTGPTQCKHYEIHLGTGATDLQRVMLPVW